MRQPSDEPTLIARQAEEIRRLTQKVKIQAQVIRAQQLTAEIRNKELTAMHWVWCDGACGAEVPEEIATMAARNTLRLLNKLRGQQWRKAAGGVKTDDV